MEYPNPRCPRCGDRYCSTVRCSLSEPFGDCSSVAGSHVHAICTRCGFEWISAGEVPPHLRTPEQIMISIGNMFDEIVRERARANYCGPARA